MSWSIQLIGKTENLIKALEEKSKSLEGAGPSKVDFDAALPHLIGLVKQNYAQDGDPALMIEANGHGHDNYRQCTVSIKHAPAVVV